MSHTANQDSPGTPVRPPKKRGAVFTVIAVSIAVHLIGGGVLAVIKIAEALKIPEFEAPIWQQKHHLHLHHPHPQHGAHKSMPRPEPLVVQNLQNMDVPAISVNDADLNMKPVEASAADWVKSAGVQWTPSKLLPLVSTRPLRVH